MHERREKNAMQRIIGKGGLGLGLIAAAALTLAACGGGGDSDSATGSQGGFTASANDICARTFEHGLRITDQAGRVSGASEAASLASQKLGLSSEEVAKLKQLDVPVDSREQFDAYLTELGGVSGALQREVSAAKQGDQGAFTAAAKAEDEGTREAEQAAAKAGLDACSETLPAEDQEDVKSLLTRTTTENDASQCTEDFTASFVDDTWGSVKECESSTGSDSGDNPTSVDVTDLQGVSGVAARATATLHGGSQDGQTLHMDLRYEDGRWKINGAQAG